MRTAIYPGSFDPITLGHLDLIKRAAKLCDRLIVGVLNNPDKQACFTPQERVSLIKKALGDRIDIEIMTFGGLLVDFVREQEADFIIRGVRNAQDFESEYGMAWANEKLFKKIETVILFTKPEFSFISSGLARQVAAFGGDLSSFLPPSAVDETLKRLYNKEHTQE